jgi:predicted ATPase with chaperone activity
MVSRITTFAFEGVEARPVDVQVQLSGGSNYFAIVGLPARERQSERFGENTPNRRPVNADAPGAEIEGLCRLDDGARALLAKAAEQLALSARAYHRVLKVSRTIADLDGAGSVARVHAAKALTYRYRPAIPAMPPQGSSKGASLAY